MDLDLQKAVEKLTLSDLVYKQTAENGEGKINLPFALAGENFYITRYYNYETQILEGIKSLILKGQVRTAGKTEKTQGIFAVQKAYQQAGTSRKRWGRTGSYWRRPWPISTTLA